jgi:hypothetical protein
MLCGIDMIKQVFLILAVHHSVYLEQAYSQQIMLGCILVMMLCLTILAQLDTSTTASTRDIVHYLEQSLSNSRSRNLVQRPSSLLR